MEINRTDQIEAFFKRCITNIQNDRKNEFIGMHVTKKSEKKVQKMLADAGIPEFNNQDIPPSLFISANEWENTPYHKNIHLDWIKDANFTFEKGKIAGYELFNSDVIQKDPNRELNDWMKLRAMDRNFEALYLYQGDMDWMFDAPSEAATNNVPASHAHGHVLTYGLGIGYFLYMALANPNVTEVTVVEKSIEVIAMFKNFIFPQFITDKPVHFIEADAFDYFNEDNHKNYDYIYVDIWQSSQDGLPIITKLLEQCYEPVSKADFWIEDSCLEIMWTLILLYFEAISNNRKIEVNPMYDIYMQKIDQYFQTIDKTISDVDTLKFYMYDTDISRRILSIKGAVTHNSLENKMSDL